MSDHVLPSQQMPQGEPAAVVLSSGDDDDDCVEIPDPRPGVPRKDKAKRAAAVVRDPLFAESWKERKAATLAVSAHSTAQGRRYTSPSLYLVVVLVVLVVLVLVTVLVVVVVVVVVRRVMWNTTLI